jgi:hypothetical protein
MRWRMSVRKSPFKTFLDENPTAKVGRGATDGEIGSAESALGVVFPPVFRRYLSELGYLEFGSAEFYGLGEGVPAHLDLVRNVMDERLRFHPHVPSHLIPFLPNYGGDHSCIDLSDPVDDPPVVFWDHELDAAQVPSRMADTFTSWLLDHTGEWA